MNKYGIRNSNFNTYVYYAISLIASHNIPMSHSVYLEIGSIPELWKSYCSSLHFRWWIMKQIESMTWLLYSSNPWGIVYVNVLSNISKFLFHVHENFTMPWSQTIITELSICLTDSHLSLWVEFILSWIN